MNFASRRLDKDFTCVMAMIRSNLVGSVQIDHCNLHLKWDHDRTVNVEWGLTKDQHIHFMTTISELETWEYSENYLPIGRI